MLAASKTPPLEDIEYPVLASPKLDGIRCLIVDGEPMTRSMKPIPNKYIRDMLIKLKLPDLDGELMTSGDFNNVQSGIMSTHGEPDFVYHVFDLHSSHKVFADRYYDLCQAVQKMGNKLIQIVIHHPVRGEVQLQNYWDKWIEQGYEGGMVRSVNGPYKQGRSTLKQGYLIKLKKWTDQEGEIVGFEELKRNENEAFEGELGQTKRSQEQAGMVGADTLGCLVLRAVINGEETEVRVGSGLDDATRHKIWTNKQYYMGKQVTFKYQELTKYGHPRFPIFMRFRLNE